MGYCVAADVQQLLKFIVFTAQSKITLDDLTNFFIADADANIDSRLSSIYQTPITDASDINLLKFISVRLAAVQAGKALMAQTSKELPKILQTWADEAEQRLQKLVTRETVLANTPLVPAGNNSGFYSHTWDTEPIWKSDTDQW